MAKGGKRVGAGRKPGTVTLRAREIADKEIKSGELDPLTVMLSNMRHFHQLATDAEGMLQGMTAKELGGGDLDEKGQFDFLLAEVRKAADLRDRSQAAARDAARYMHAPIAAVASNGASQEATIPLAKRLEMYARRDAIEASGSKVVELKR